MLSYKAISGCFQRKQKKAQIAQAISNQKNKKTNKMTL